MPPQEHGAGRHSGRRHGPWQNPPDTHLSFLAQEAEETRQIQSVVGDLPGIGDAQLAPGSREVHARHVGAGTRKRRGAASLAEEDSRSRYCGHMATIMEFSRYGPLQ